MIRISIKSIFLVILTISLVSCFSIKPGAVKSGKNLYESFFISNKGIQYFIKPMCFKNSEINSKFYADFTFINKQSNDDSAVCNFSIHHTEKIYKKLDSVLFCSAVNEKIALQEIRILFNEKYKNYFESRFSSKISTKDLRKLFNSNSWHIDVEGLKFDTPKKTSANLNKLNSSIFKLMD